MMKAALFGRARRFALWSAPLIALAGALFAILLKAEELQTNTAFVAVFLAFFLSGIACGAVSTWCFIKASYGPPDFDPERDRLDRAV